MEEIIYLNQKALKFLPWVRADFISEQGLTILRKKKVGDVVSISVKGKIYYAYFEGLDSKVPLKVFSADTNLISEHIKRALTTSIRIRSKIKIDSNAFRVFFSEADDVPGLIIDKYDDLVVIHLTSKGLYKHIELIESVITQELNPRHIVFKFGDSPIQASISKIVKEHDVLYEVNFASPQKTGLYLDQRINRKFLRDILRGNETVLDLFCYSGGFGLNALKAGCKKVVFVDESSKSLECLKRNLELNNISFDRVEIYQQNVFEFLKQKLRHSFDFIICDPPAFTRSKKHLPTAIVAYRRLVRGCLNFLSKDGFLLLFSCSHHVSLSDLERIIYQEALKNNFRLPRVLARLFQSPDHPFKINIPPTLYLKGVFVHIS